MWRVFIKYNMGIIFEVSEVFEFDVDINLGLISKLKYLGGQERGTRMNVIRIPAWVSFLEFPGR